MAPLRTVRQGPKEEARRLHFPSRAQWRSWLQENGQHQTEVWVELPRHSFLQSRRGRQTEQGAIMTYLDLVEEALCFGWIDGLTRSTGEGRVIRMTPRQRLRSNWTQLNKDRARRMIQQKLMTPEGEAVLPDLTIEDICLKPDILESLRNASAFENFVSFPESYKRIRIGYIEEMRRQPSEFQMRLANFVKKTKQNKMFGNWDDSSLPVSRRT